ncbi:aromatic prenyltransferase [Panaeolus papilionaceus]|nr:aromatic prenyltransferase [Panaeolus papilionaceus]
MISSCCKEAFLQNDCVGKSIVPIMLGIDYIHPLESRLKVYARSHLTSFSCAKHTMSFGGQRVPHGSERIQRKGLWYRVLGLPRDLLVSQELPACLHQTVGIVFYFDFGPKTPLPDVKVYMPVRHYGGFNRSFRVSKEEGDARRVMCAL